VRFKRNESTWHWIPWRWRHGAEIRRNFIRCDDFELFYVLLLVTVIILRTTHGVCNVKFVTLKCPKIKITSFMTGWLLWGGLVVALERAATGKSWRGAEYCRPRKQFKRSFEGKYCKAWVSPWVFFDWLSVWGRAAVAKCEAQITI
jgi:hypothetical protein